MYISNVLINIIVIDINDIIDKVWTILSMYNILLLDLALYSILCRSSLVR